MAKAGDILGAERQRRYRATELGRRAYERYAASPKRKANLSKHSKTEKFKKTQDRYRQRAKGYEARRRYALLQNYGVTLEQYEEILARQGGHCALCEKTNRLHLDHDHVTGRVRGILCSGHNTAIGKLGDNEAGLQRAIEYLRRNE